MPPSQRSARGKDSIEDRRARGEVSCAECRRHKLKCDRNIPCSTCVRKGCQAICPNGTLAPTSTSRANETDVDALKARIADMSHRIRQLEDALQISHNSISTEPHPLLAPDLLNAKNGPSPSIALKSESSSVESELLDSLGTLAVSDRGTESYLGATDTLLLNLQATYPDALCPDLILPAPVSYLSKTFPFTPLYLPAQEIRECIEENLPSYERASSLVEAYLGNISWFFRPVDREQIMEELIPVVYKRRRQASGSEIDSSRSGVSADAHVLALLIALFAVGAAADLTLPPWNDEAELYYHLARTTLGLKPVFEGSGLHAVQAIALLGAYDLFACRKVTIDGTWKTIAFSLSLAASIGLNRDPAHFKFSSKFIQRRRRVFWEIYGLDVWKSVATGRPMTFTPEVVDCEFPEDTDAKDAHSNIGLPNSIWWVRQRYVKEIMQEVATLLGSVRSIKYSEILAMDQRIRDYDPDGMFNNARRDSGSGQDDDALFSFMKRDQLDILKDITLVMLHRTFFSRALVEDSENPIRTRFGPSFLSTYRSCASLVNTTRRLFERTEHHMMRLWPISGHALFASAALASIAACGTASALAPQAYVQFDLAYEMFSKVQMHPLVSIALPILARMREQALQALAKHGNKIPSRPSFVPATDSRSGNDEEFDSVRSMAKTVSKSFAGDFGTVPRPYEFYYDPRLAPTTTQNSLFFPGEVASHLTGDPATRSDPTQNLMGMRQSGGLPKQMERQPFASMPSVEMSTEATEGQEHSTACSPSSATSQHEAHDTAKDLAYMQVDYSPFPSGASTSNAQESDPFVFSFSKASSSSGANSDGFNPYTPFPEMTDPSVGPTFDKMPGFPSGPGQEGTFFNSSPSNLSPGMFFSSDFDVSIDMRSSLGQENVLPMLPEDMEAWRTFLQDSRFSGMCGGVTESEKTTPK